MRRITTTITNIVCRIVIMSVNLNVIQQIGRVIEIVKIKPLIKGFAIQFTCVDLAIGNGAVGEPSCLVKGIGATITAIPTKWLTAVADVGTTDLCEFLEDIVTIFVGCLYQFF